MRSEAENRPTPAPLWQRLGWFIGIWLVSIGALGIIAYGIRLVLL